MTSTQFISLLAQQGIGRDAAFAAQGATELAGLIRGRYGSRLRDRRRPDQSLPGPHRRRGEQAQVPALRDSSRLRNKVGGQSQATDEAGPADRPTAPGRAVPVRRQAILQRADRRQRRRRRLGHCRRARSGGARRSRRNAAGHAVGYRSPPRTASGSCSCATARPAAAPCWSTSSRPPSRSIRRTAGSGRRRQPSEALRSQLHGCDNGSHRRQGRRRPRRGPGEADAGDLAPAFRDAATNLPVGEVSEPIRSDQGACTCLVVCSKRSNTAQWSRLTTRSKTSWIGEQLRDDQTSATCATCATRLHREVREKLQAGS